MTLSPVVRKCSYEDRSPFEAPSEPLRSPLFLEGVRKPLRSPFEGGYEPTMDRIADPIRSDPIRTRERERTPDELSVAVASSRPVPCRGRNRKWIWIPRKEVSLAPLQFFPFTPSEAIQLLSVPKGADHMQNISDDDWLSVAEAAAWMKTGPRTIFAAIRAGHLKAARVNNRGDFRILRGWLVEWASALAKRELRA